MESPNLYAGEVQLAGWSETHNGGCKLILWLPDSSCLDPFRALTVRKGNQAGHVMMCVMVEVDNEGQPVAPPPPKTPHSLSRLAALLCENPTFWTWMLEAFGMEVKTPAQAADWMRELLAIDSRAELDTDPDAAAAFHENIRLPFVRWQGQQ